jgi:hypothetical protein
VGTGDSVSAADVPVRNEAAEVWLASAKAVSMKGVTGVPVCTGWSDPPVESGVAVETAEVGEPVAVDDGNGVALDRTTRAVHVGTDWVRVGPRPGSEVFVTVEVCDGVNVTVTVGVSEGVNVGVAENAGLEVCVAEGVAVTVKVEEGLGIGVRVAVGTRRGVLVGRLVLVGFFVGGASTWPCPSEPFQPAPATPAGK